MLGATLIVVAGIGEVPNLDDPVRTLAGEMGDARFGSGLAGEISTTSVAAGPRFSDEESEAQRAELHDALRLYARGAWEKVAAKLDAMRLRLEAAPAALTRDVSLRSTLYDTRVMLADSLRRLGEDELARDFMAAAIRGAPRDAPSPILFSPDVQEFYERVSTELASAPRHTLTLQLRPRSAALFVEGRPVGDSPTRVPGLPAGDYVVGARDGERSGRFHRVLVDRDRTLSLDLTLDRALRFEQRAALVFTSEAERKRDQTAAAASLGRELQAQYVVVLRATDDSLIGALIATDTAKLAAEITTPAREPRELGQLLAQARDGHTARRIDISAAGKPRPYRLWKWLSLGGALVLSGLGGGLLGAHDTCARQTRTGACVERRDYFAVGAALLGVGGALALTSAPLFVLDAQ